MSGQNCYTCDEIEYLYLVILDIEKDITAAGASRDDKTDGEREIAEIESRICELEEHHYCLNVSSTNHM